MGKPTTIEMQKIFCCLSSCYHAIYVPRDDEGPWYCCKEHMDQSKAEQRAPSESDGRAITDSFNDQGGSLMKIDKETKLLKQIVTNIQQRPVVL